MRRFPKHLEGKQQDHCLDALLTSVNIITKKEVVAVGRKAATLKEPQEILVLSMNITTDLQGRLKFQE